MNADPSPHLFVYGSCVARDAVEPLVQEGYTLDGYVARQSLISALRPADRRLLPELRPASPFQGRMWDGDVAAGLFPALRALDVGPRRVVVWDIVDERLGVYELPDGSYLTRSVELEASGNAPEVASLGRLVPFGDDDHFRLWRMGFATLRMTLSDAGVREEDCVLLAVPWAAQLDDGTPAPASFGVTAAVANQLGGRYFDHVRDASAMTVLRPSSEAMTADREHRWGLAPFHFTEASYDPVREAIRERLTIEASPDDPPVRILVVGGKPPPAKARLKTLAAVRQPVTCAYGRHLRDDHPLYTRLREHPKPAVRMQSRGGLRAQLNRHAAQTDLVIVDLADELHGCYVVAPGTYLSAAALSQDPELAAHVAKEYPLVAFGSLEHEALWRSGLRRFVQELDEKGLLHRAVVLRCEDDVAPAAGGATGGESGIRVPGALHAERLDRYLTAATDDGRLVAVRVPHRRSSADALLGARVPSDALPVAEGALRPRPRAGTIRVRRRELGSVEVLNLRKATAYRRGGDLLVAVLADGRPCRFAELRVADGVALRHFDDDGHSVGATLLAHLSGSLFGSMRRPNDGTLWRLGTGSTRPEVIAESLAGESLLRAAADDGAGGIFVTTYPHAKLIHLPESGTARDLGPVYSGAAYAWTLHPEDDDVWVGTGPEPALVRVARATAERQVHGLPGAFAAAGNFVTHLATTREAVHVGVTTDPSVGARFLRLDRSALTWSMSSGPAGLALPSHAVWDSTRHRLWFVIEGSLWSTDLESAPTVSATPGLSPDVLDATRALCVVAKTGELVGVTPQGTAWSWSPDGATMHSVLDLPPSHASVHSLGRLPDGRAIAGLFFGPERLAVLPDDGPARTVPGPRQVDVVTTEGDSTFLGAYPGAGVYRVAPPEPGGLDPVVTPVLTLGRDESGQDRTTAVCVIPPDPGNHHARDNSTGQHHDDAHPVWLAVGTVPTYGRLGGRVVFVDVGHGSRSVAHHEVEPVRDQSVTALTLHQGQLYGGTTPDGGLGSTPRTSGARLFAMDLETRGTVWTSSLPTNSRSVGALLSLDTGLLVLTVEGDLLLVDPATASVTSMLRTGLRSSAGWGRRAALLPAADGGALGVNGGTLFRVDPDLTSWQILTAGVQVIGQGPDDTVLVSDGRTVTRLSLTSPRSA